MTCTGHEVDQYGRLVGLCSAGGTELNRAMVSSGWATAFRRYSEDYVAEESRARSARAGLWDSDFQRPEDYRAEERGDPAPVDVVRLAAPPSRSSSGCVIKGNKSRRGPWIYHLPGMPRYNETRAEEMFCSEAEAQAAGYRRAIVR